MSLIDHISNEAQLNIVEARQRSRNIVSRAIVIKLFRNGLSRIELLMQLSELLSCKAILTEILQYKILPVCQQVKHAVDVHGMLFP